MGPEIIDLVDKPHSSRCLNSACASDSKEYLSAPDFCLSYFRVKRSKTYKEEICFDCYDKAVQDFDKLATKLKNKELLLEVDYPIINETLQIDDSDEEDDNVAQETEYISNENFKFISKHIDDILTTTLQNFNIEKQYKLESDYLQKENQNVKGKSFIIHSFILTIDYLILFTNIVYYFF